MTRSNYWWLRGGRGIAVVATIASAFLLSACGSKSSDTEQLATQVQQLTEQLTDAQNKLAGMQTSITHLQDVHAIKKLERAYGYYVDKGLWSQVVGLFADDGTVQLARMGIYKGKDGVARLFSKTFGTDMGRGPGTDGLGKGVLFNHPQLQGIVDVDPDGKTAHGRWKTLAQVAWQGRLAMWNSGVYENDYIKQDGVWKIQHMRFWPTYYTRYEQGWAKQTTPAVGGGEKPEDQKYPPDVQPTEQDRQTMYPNYYFVPPFHYPNPVTGNPVKSPGPPEK